MYLKLVITFRHGFRGFHGLYPCLSTQYIFKLLYLPPMPRPVLPQVQLRGLQCQPSIQRYLFQILGLDACHQDRERVGIEEEWGQVGFRILADELVGGMFEGDPVGAGAI